MNAPHEHSRVNPEAGTNTVGKWRTASCSAAMALGALLVAQPDPADAQGRRQRQQARQAPATSQFIPCPAPGQPLVRIPEIVSANGKLHGTILLASGPQRFFLGDVDQNNQPQCVPQFARYFRAFAPSLPGYDGLIPAGPAGFPEAPPVLPASDFPDPVPGPTLRARLGDLVQLTFLNQINPNDFGDSIDRGERGQGCDESTRPYPGLDEFPDCFHGSSTGNIHFHGTHTSPSTTGDNVFIEVRPSVRENRQPVVTPESVKDAFEEFFFNCETELGKGPLVQWPRIWSDLPRSFRESHVALLRRYDADPAIKNKLLPVNEAQIRRGAWPQYYIGAFPYCFRLPRYLAAATTQASTQAAKPPEPSHVAHVHAGPPRDPPRTLQMGQAPGTHWYHAHKHGSTTINVSNGMTGAFIIEGDYDDALNGFYGQGWARTQPVLVVNQLSTSPNLIGGAGAISGLPFSVNGRLQPELTMQPGEVQLWRIANTSSRGGVYIDSFRPAGGMGPTQFQWRQTAQDGVQFNGTNYSSAQNQNSNLLLASGNRADILIQAPPTAGRYTLYVREVRSRCETLPANQVPTIPVPQQPPPSPPPQTTPICSPQPPIPFLNVNVTGAPATGPQSQFIPADQLQRSFPGFLKDIADDEVKGTKTVVFESTPTTGFPLAMHTIDGHKFDGNVGQVVLLNTAEEWKIVNKTVNGGIQNGAPVTTDPPGVVDHPFHIHINPFQITEVFDPNEVLPNGTPRYIFSGTAGTGQCLLDITRPETWKPCDSGPKRNLIWWDVFPIPTARAVFTGTAPNAQVTVVPGYFKMRSRFVDYTGQYVIHCHILAHEDRGMMTIVQVVPFTTPYSHK
jgi:FtsP/CotA-like multicopper oxidase with cupredoxin domain